MSGNVPLRACHTCGAIVKDGNRYCPTHQDDDTRHRRQGSTRQWRNLRKLILNRDNYRCQIEGPGCTRWATHVDHIDPQGGDLPANLRAACEHCNTSRGNRDDRP
jgi:5-methylcytosine-specific restriction endonuclease McrA